MADKKKDAAVDAAPEDDVNTNADPEQGAVDITVEGESPSQDTESSQGAADTPDIDDTFEALMAERDSLKDQLLRALGHEQHILAEDDTIMIKPLNANCTSAR